MGDRPGGPGSGRKASQSFELGGVAPWPNWSPPSGFGTEKLLVPSDGQPHKVCEQLQRQSTTCHGSIVSDTAAARACPHARCATGRPPSLRLLSSEAAPTASPAPGPAQFLSLFRNNSCLLEAARGRPHSGRPEGQTLTCGVYGSDDYFHRS